LNAAGYLWLAASNQKTLKTELWVGETDKRRWSAADAST
jgi:hypothetical protein